MDSFLATDHAALLHLIVFHSNLLLVYVLNVASKISLLWCNFQRTTLACRPIHSQLQFGWRAIPLVPDMKQDAAFFATWMLLKHLAAYLAFHFIEREDWLLDLAVA